MTVLLALAGAVAGAAVGGLSGLLAGAAIGLLLGQQLDLRKRLERVEETQARVDELQLWATEMKTWAKQTHAWLKGLGRSAQPADARMDMAAELDAATEEATATEPGAPAPPDPSTVAPRALDLAATGPRTQGPAAGVREPAPAGAGAGPSRSARGDAVGGVPREPSADPLTWIFHAVKRWVTTGNAPVKVGVLVSLVGVGLLLREAHQRGIINLTIEVRLVAAAVFGLVLLAVGWRLRRRRPVYGLSLQGGGIAVLYVASYAAFAVYDVLPAAPAVLAVVVVTVGAGVLSVLEDSRVLAVLGIIGGFLAPVLTYSRPEDHVYVFGFFAVLNAAIIGVAWYKTWPELNLLGFGFTFGLTLYWLSSRYQQDEWGATQPFIALFVLMYMALPTLFAVRDAPDLKRVWTESPMSGTRSPLAGTEFVRGAWTTPMVFGTPFIGLGLQHIAIGHTEYGLAVSAAGLAAAQGVLAMVASRLGVERHQLTEAYGALAVAFSAIAVPLALDAYFTATVWAVQGLVLMWLGCRRDRLLALSGGAVLQILAAASFVEHLSESLPYTPNTAPIANETFVGALLLAAAGLASGWLLRRRPRSDGTDQALPWLALAWGASWWLAGGIIEIVQQLPAGGELSASLGFVAGSMAVASLGARRLSLPQLEALGLLILPALLVVLFLSLQTQPHPFDRWGWTAWPPALAAHYLFLGRRENSFPRMTGSLHAGGLWMLAALVALEVYWQAGEVADGVWPFAATAAAALATVGATMTAGRRLAWPFAAHWRSYLVACASPMLVALSVVVLVGAVVSDGDPSPLFFLPVLNPLGVLVGAQLAASFVWRRLAAAEPDHPFRNLATARSTPTLAVAGGVLATAETARTVHHWSGVAWEVGALWESTELQASLSILWAVMALSAMVAGVRLARRAVWVAGASWMAVVVAKLFLIDLSSLTAAGRVVSFIVVGILLLIVGYLAPVPPAAPQESAEPDAPNQPAATPTAPNQPTEPDAPNQPA